MGTAPKGAFRRGNPKNQTVAAAAAAESGGRVAAGAQAASRGLAVVAVAGGIVTGTRTGHVSIDPAHLSNCRRAHPRLRHLGPLTDTVSIRPNTPVGPLDRGPRAIPCARCDSNRLTIASVGAYLLVLLSLFSMPPENE